MRKLLIGLIAAAAACSAIAHEHGFRHYRYYSPAPIYQPSYGWVVPTIIGGVIGYEIARSQQPVIVQNPAPYGYHYENVLDANCNCYRTVLVRD